MAIGLAFELALCAFLFVIFDRKGRVALPLFRKAMDMSTPRATRDVASGLVLRSTNKLTHWGIEGKSSVGHIYHSFPPDGIKKQGVRNLLVETCQAGSMTKEWFVRTSAMDRQ